MEVLHKGALGQLLLNFFPVLVRKLLKHRPPCKRIFFGGFRDSFVSLSRQLFKHPPPVCHSKKRGEEVYASAFRLQDQPDHA